MNGNDEAPRTGAPQTPFRLPLFAGFDAPALALVIEVLQEEKLPAGHVAIEDNTPGETLDTVTIGRVQVSKTLDIGPEYLFAEMGRASFWRDGGTGGESVFGPGLDADSQLAPGHAPPDVQSPY